ncbi:uncharacterized protein MONBRDRAFT_25248 [Monosiga brevicollis MX1]|uniref:Sulfatase N-terminal domain-containing protein n=1 Tax=Monosiga brevicollis TaxID=81824 RepID=A9UYU7_MONBE|nr:uncharacterized protein MONBRDRAFT_25248 [Monosiga brevicollis MX1]EDQ89668.1 predicted protein [Monosiga brevicollis MX1]|eukprot:XP_001745697.1 hypothetical protein [Monosiga brevicollis MX1]
MGWGLYVPHCSLPLWSRVLSLQLRFAVATQFKPLSLSLSLSLSNQFNFLSLFLSLSKLKISQPTILSSLATTGKHQQSGTDRSDAMTVSQTAVSMATGLVFLAVVNGVWSMEQPNILYLVADDMRSELNTYGHHFMITPNLDALAASGLQFDFASTQFAYCAPSRNSHFSLQSFMTGRRPDRTGCLNFMHKFRDFHPNWTTMPEFFKDRGYFTTSAGKIYHDGMDDPKSWSYPSNQTAWIQCGAGDETGQFNNYCGITNSSANPYTDEDLALTEGLKRLELAVNSGQPWWVSIGVHRPHAPYRVPAGFYGPEVYPPGSNDAVQSPKHPGPATDGPFMAGNWNDGDITDPAHGCPTCIIPSNRTDEYRRWYMAAITYSDHMLGQALQKLEELGQANNTIVVFHSGGPLSNEATLNEWSKKTDSELAVHVPLIIRVPWKPSSQGQRTIVKAELVDLYRTLAELAGFNQDQVSQCNSNACAYVDVSQFDYIGYTIRDHNYRYTAWVPFDNSTMRVDWSRLQAEELYDLSDFDGRDFDYDGIYGNVAGNSTHQATVKRLRQALEAAVATWH